MNGEKLSRFAALVAEQLLGHGFAALVAEQLLRGEFADLVAQRTAEALIEAGEQAGASGSDLVDATTLATALGISRATVYRRADQLGAERLGDGPKAPLRFDVARARAAYKRPGDRV